MLHSFKFFFGTDVAGNAINKLLFAGSGAVPLNPAIGTILAPVTVHEKREGFASYDALGGGHGFLVVVRMNEMEPRMRSQFVEGMAESALPGGAELLKTSIEAGDGHEVGRELEKAAELLGNDAQLRFNLSSFLDVAAENACVTPGGEWNDDEEKGLFAEHLIPFEATTGLQSGLDVSPDVVRHRLAGMAAPGTKHLPARAISEEEGAVSRDAQHRAGVFLGELRGDLTRGNGCFRFGHRC